MPNATNVTAQNREKTVSLQQQIEDEEFDWPKNRGEVKDDLEKARTLIAVAKESERWGAYGRALSLIKQSKHVATRARAARVQMDGSRKAASA